MTWTDGSTHHVDVDAFGTIQAGAYVVAVGGTVAAAAGTYSEALTLAKGLTLAGSGTAATILQPPSGLTGGPQVEVAGPAVVTISNIAVAGASGLTGIDDNGGTLTATGITISGDAAGISVENKGAVTVTRVALTGDGTGITVGAGASDTSTATLADDSFAGDTTGVRDLQSGGTIAATSDWWGSLHGPSAAGNPGGNGAAVSANVSFSPWIGLYTNNTPAGQPGFNPTGITSYAVPTRLVFVTQPSSNPAPGAAFAQQPVVEAEDAAGNLGINFDSSTVAGSKVSLALNAGGYSGTLSGTAAVAATGGIATFSGLGITAPGVYTLTASGPGAPWTGLGAGTSSTITINFPTPGLTSMSPNRAGVGYPYPWAVIINGSGFYPLSVAYWNSTAVPTTYVSSTQLVAAIPASDLTVAGNATIAVSNPAPGGGTSSGANYQVVAGSESVYVGGALYLLETSGQLDEFYGGNAVVLDTNDVLNFTWNSSSAGVTLYVLEGNPPGGTGGRLMQYTSWGGWTTLDTYDVLSFAMSPNGTTLYDLEGNRPGWGNGGVLAQYVVGGGWSVLDSNDVLSFAMSPDGTTLYDLEGNLPGNAGGGRLVQYVVGGGWSLLDGYDVLSFTMNAAGTALYDLEGSRPGWGNGGVLMQDTVGVGWSVLDSNDVLSFALNPSCGVVYDLEGNLPGYANGGRLVQYNPGVGWSLLDNNDVLSFAMSPDGSTLYDLEGNLPGYANGGRLVQYTVGFGWSLLDGYDVLSFAMSPSGAVLYDLEGNRPGSGSNGVLMQDMVGGGWSVLDNNNVLSFAMNPSGKILYDLEGNGDLWQYTAARAGTRSTTMGPPRSP